MKNKLIDISDDLTDLAYERLKVGSILRFKSEKGESELKIVRLNRKSRKCFAKAVRTFTPEELDATVTFVDK